MPAWTGVEARRLYPGWRCKGTFDVSGGWYDAGDYGKYVTSGGIAVWQLLSTLDLLRRADSSLPHREFADLIRGECRWQLDWLMRMQVPPGDPLSGLAFHRVHGTQWSPMPGWAHEDPTERVLHRPSTAATLHLAAVAAKGARLFRATDPAYTGTLLEAARTAYDAARRHPHLIAPDDHARFGGGPYADDQLEDDFYWAAVELWLTTDEEFYRQEVLSSAQHTADAFDPAGFDFDRVTAPGRLDLALAGSHLADHDRVVESVLHGADRLLELQRQQPWGQPYAPTEGWHWGSNGRILNNLVVLAVAQLVSGASHYADAVATGMDYLLGRNALGQSYITGYGTDYSCHQRTRQFGHDLDPAFPPPPPGALAGGANSRPAPDFPYDPRLLGASTSVLLPRRAHLRGHQRRLYSLECTSGLGRHLLEHLERGHRIRRVDSSPTAFECGGPRPTTLTCYSSLPDKRLAASSRRRASASAFTASRCRDCASARCR